MPKITVQKDGPYMVEGADVLDWNGVSYPRGEGAVSLCRCGASRNKPFCDGTHTKIGFKASEAADQVKK